MNKKDLSILFDKLFPINRSILGQGYRKSLNILKKYIKLKEIKYISGKKIFDWKVPLEWEIKDAYIEFQNKKIVDFKKNNLHVVNYSSKIKKSISLKYSIKFIFIKKISKLYSLCYILL